MTNIVNAKLSAHSVVEDSEQAREYALGFEGNPHRDRQLTALMVLMLWRTAPAFALVVEDGQKGETDLIFTVWLDGKQTTVINVNWIRSHSAKFFAADHTLLATDRPYLDKITELFALFDGLTAVPEGYVAPAGTLVELPPIVERSGAKPEFIDVEPMAIPHATDNLLDTLYEMVFNTSNSLRPIRFAKTLDGNLRIEYPSVKVDVPAEFEQQPNADALLVREFKVQATEASNAS